MLTLQQCQILAYKMAADDKCPTDDPGEVLIDAEVEPCHIQGCKYCLAYTFRAWAAYGNGPKEEREYRIKLTACSVCGVNEEKL